MSIPAITTRGMRAIAGGSTSTAVKIVTAQTSTESGVRAPPGG